MIGKKSKFNEHEQSRTKVQTKESINGGTAQDNPSSDSGKGEEGKLQGLHSEGTLEGDRIIKTADLPDGREFESLGIPKSAAENCLGEESQGFETEMQETEEQLDLLRSETRENTSDYTGDFSTTSKQKLSEFKPTIIKAKNIKSDSEMLWNEICNGVNGKNSGIPMGFNRLNKYLGLRKSIYTLIGGNAGTGKTSLVDCAYVLNPYDWYIKNKNKISTKVKFEVTYFSMERKKTYKLAKWLCMKIWMEEKTLITTDELLSWQNTLDKRKQEMAKFYIDNYFKEMMESGIITIIDGSQNPTGIYKMLYANALSKGKEEEISQWEKRYIPNDDNLITNVIIDHIGKTKLENIGGKYEKKLSIDKLSEYLSWSRDYLHYSPVVVSQFNRTSYQDIQFSKKEGGDPDPTVEYFKDSGNTVEDADVVLSIFNPYKYNLEEYMNYNINDFTDDVGNNKFRGLKIIKNSYGTDSLRVGLAFLGEVSLFKELTKSKDITQKEINSVINNDFFLGF